MCESGNLAYVSDKDSQANCLLVRTLSNCATDHRKILTAAESALRAGRTSHEYPAHGQVTVEHSQVGPFAGGDAAAVGVTAGDAGRGQAGRSDMAQNR
jgi:hypothetical protein